MREIKFRAWDKLTSDWVIRNGVQLSGDDDTFGCLWGDDLFSESSANDEMRFEYKPENVELMQYTGLKDKNGKEIYEKDCLGGVYEGLYIDYCDSCKQFQLFNCLEECMACIGDVHWFEVVGYEDFEIIGNRFENPELLSDILIDE